MISFIIDFAIQTYKVFYEASIYILAGFFLAGLVRIVLRTDLLQRMLGADSFASVVKAALFGTPLPICSCGVVPAAVSLRKNGASRPATMSFLISTPETGLPSILLTWGLIGPLMAVIRPVVAMITALTAGTWILLSPGRGAKAEQLPGDGVDSCGGDAEAPETSCCASGETAAGDGACCGAHDGHESSCCSGADDGMEAKPDEERGPGRRAWSVVREALHYGYVEMMDDLAFWIVFGMVLTGLLGALLPDNFFDRVMMGNPTLEMAAMLLVGIPLYLCATSSTPLAATFIAKGLSPGAALVFLLAGPVTNIGTLMIVGRVFGRRFLRIYLLSIIIVCMALGMVTNAVWGDHQFTIWGQEDTDPSPITVLLQFAGLLAFTVLAGASFQRTGFRKDIKELWEHLKTFAAWLRGLDPTLLLRRPGFWYTVFIVAVFYLLQGFFIVSPGEVGMVRQFGKLTRSGLSPGLHYCPPWPVALAETCRTEEVRVVSGGFQALVEEAPAAEELALGESRRRFAARQFTEESLFITGEENIIQITYAAHYRVEDPVRFLYAVEDADQLVGRVVRSMLMEIIGRQPIDEIYTTARAAVEDETARRAQAVLHSDAPGSYGTGIRLVSVHLLDAHAPLEVHDAFRDVASAMEDCNTMVNQAEGYREERLHLARGEADRDVARAKAAGAASLLAAEGDTAGFLSLVEATEGNERLTRYRLYMESAERVLPRARLYITPDGRDLGQFDLWLRSSTPEECAICDSEKTTQTSPEESNR